MSPRARKTGAHDELLYVPLGGVGEIGMNLSLYGLGSGRARQWLAIDLGVSFADETVPGVDLMMPDIRFLEAERANLAGLVITHAHEDHIGAVYELWPRLRCPVYASPFAAALLSAKKAFEPGAEEVPVTVVQPGSRLTIGAYDVEFIPVAHSIPEAMSIALRTPLGNVLHTGDWKLDPTPVIGPPTDEAALQRLGDEGLRALICDSTNAMRSGKSPSEADVAVALDELIGSAKGRVAVTTFASNVARLRAVADAAKRHDREVVVVGRAMERVINVARDLGYLDGLPAFRSPETYGYLPRDKVVALLTGSQGEPRAALARIAHDDHPEIALAKGDRVIFSSRTIPGNERSVYAIMNALVRQGVEIITDRTHLVHVSGHPRQDEMRQMYALTRPQLAVPVHGEALHMHEHAALARACGTPEVLQARNGDVVRLAPGPAEIVDEAPAGRLYKDGLLLVDAAAPAIAERRKLSYVGVVSASVVITAKGELAADPEIEVAGLPAEGIDGDALEDVAFEAALNALQSMPKPRRRDPDVVEEAVRRAIRGSINAQWGKKPVCHVLVSVV